MRLRVLVEGGDTVALINRKAAVGAPQAGVHFWIKAIFV